ncbi:hypothetical protein ACF1BQ_025460 [Bradyrhizobium sp. RDT10]
MSALGDVLQFDVDDLDEGVADRVRVLVNELKPNELRDRVRFLITEMPWDYPVDEQLEFEERGKRQVEAVETLVRDLLAQPDELHAVLPQLSVGDQRMTVAAGHAIAKFSVNPQEWGVIIERAIEEAPAGNRNFGLVTGYYAAMSSIDAAFVEAFKRRSVTSPVIAPALPLVCSHIGVSASDVSLVIDALRLGTVTPSATSFWTMGARSPGCPCWKWHHYLISCSPWTA